MTKAYTIKGLSCANCAAKIERSVQALPGVRQASCDAIRQALVVDVEAEAVDALDRPLREIVYGYEPDVEVIDRTTTGVNWAQPQDSEARRQIIQLAAGALVFVVALLIPDNPAKSFLFLASYAILGWEVLWGAVRTIARRQFLDERFLMSIASLGAFVVGEYAEAVAVMLFYQVGEYYQDSAVRRSKKSIADLMNIRPDYANIRVDGAIQSVAPETVAIGDLIFIKPGEKIPLDGVVTEGESSLDASALTGESLPRNVGVGDSVLSGCVNLNGTLTVRVTKVFGESTAAKIIELVENASAKKAPAENFITTFSRYYTPVVVVMAGLLAVLPPLCVGGSWAEWIHRALVFLVISCPCALVISVPLSYFGGIGGASRNGVLVKGGNYLDALDKVDTLVFDKTGTLTQGVFKVKTIHTANGFSSAELLQWASQAETFSSHPIARSIVQACRESTAGQEENRSLGQDTVKDYKEIPGYGVSASIQGKTVFAGSALLLKRENILFEPVSDIGAKVYVSVDGTYAGCLVIADLVKPDSREALAGLKKQGIRKTVMLTGDNQETAEAIGQTVGIDEVYGGLLPNQKVAAVERLESELPPKAKLAFVGDGINDAPVLARADVGIAMGGLGSDAAIEAADVVLMTDEPSKLITAIRIAKATKRIVLQNITFALAMKGLFLLLGAMGISGMWEAVFADVGVSLLATLNALRAMRVK